MKYFSFILLFFIVACNNITYTDQGFTNRNEAKNLMVDGVKEGKWVEYGFLLWIVRSDTLSYTLTIYKDGAPYGIVRKYYMNGKLEGETTYKDGKLNGVDRGYYKNGVLRAESPFTNNVYNGIVKGYYDNGQLQFEATYINGVQNGIERHYHPNGKLESEITWKDGKKIATKDYPENDYH